MPTPALRAIVSSAAAPSAAVSSASATSRRRRRLRVASARGIGGTSVSGTVIIRRDLRILRERTMSEPLGRLGSRSVHRIGYGAMQLAERAAPPREVAVAVLRRTAELGVD